MAKKAEPAKLSVRIDRRLLIWLKMECAKRDVRMQKAVTEAVFLWLDKEPGTRGKMKGAVLQWPKKS